MTTSTTPSRRREPSGIGGPGSLILGAVAFAAELAALAAVVQWAFMRGDGPARWVAATTAAVGFAWAWGRWLAPRASHLLPGAWPRVGKGAVFVTAAAAAASAWGLLPAIVLGAVGVATALPARAEMVLPDRPIRVDFPARAGEGARPEPAAAVGVSRCGR